jgi:hypothetical protein
MQENQTPPQAEIFHIIGGYWLSRAVYLAARLKLADAVGDRPTSLASIAAVTGAKLENLRRLMRALAGHGFFRDEGNETFGQTPLSETLRSDRSGSMRAFAEAELGHDHYDSWRNVEGCLRDRCRDRIAADE